MPTAADGEDAKAMKTDFLVGVLESINPLRCRVLDLEISRRVDSEISKLPWKGSNIDWAGKNYHFIDLTDEGIYTSDSVTGESIRRFHALKNDQVVLMFSAYEPPVAMASSDFIAHWLAICGNLTFLPKFILISDADLRVESPKFVEVDPMHFMKGHV